MESGIKIVSANVSTEPTCELAASSSQNSLSGSSFMEVNADMNSTSTEPTCELAASSSRNSLPGCSSLVCLCEEDLPGTSLTCMNLSPPCSEAHTLVKVQSCYHSWVEPGPSEAVCRLYLYISVIMIYLSNINLHSWI